MRWRGRRQSENIEDRRGSAGPKMAIGGGIGVLVIAVIAMLMGGDPQALMEQIQGAGGAGGPGAAQTGDGPVQESEAEAELRQFVATVLADTEDVWHTLLDDSRTPYREPTLVFFRDGVSSACGSQSSAVGPFYCPGDDRVYLDLGFFEELMRRFGAKGDFARAYVVAHEVGHHVQNLLGISAKVHGKQRGLGKAEANELSVRLELQADFLAGVWAHHAHRMSSILEHGDIEEALGAASAIGDDTLQRKSTGRVMPESLHPRHLGTTRALVPARPGKRRLGPGRHVLGGRPRPVALAAP